ncbi:CheW-like domain protein [Thalassoglobus neptunius]|uniref:CheW-like domain protein n=1 Tax=Thalassoglobus neptunius TaxID=1938619 RepID=A0A5C5X8D1_9PLAN|nr:chemotaxis protein CheW [Thalassoglobus neptunius]TWT58122.1 CheW-like domain protein [Thalassoglobus neptunius]
MNHTSMFCIFRKGRTWLAMPASVVREVMPRPAFVSIPRTHRVLSGMCHIRSEFIPVLNLSSLLPSETVGHEPFLLIVEDTDGDWSILVDEVDSLAMLETSDAPENSQSGWNETVIGWATLQDRVVRLLDHVRFRQLAETEMKDSWKRGLDQGHVLTDDFSDADDDESAELSGQHAVVMSRKS